MIKTRSYSPFRMEKLEGKNCKEVMDKGIEITLRHTDKYWISAGTALGLIRDKEFIPWDTDIDIEIIDDIDPNELVKDFIKEGFILIRTQEDEEGFKQIAFLYPDGHLIFDIYLYTKDGDNYINNNEAGQLTIPTSMVDNLEKVEVLGTKYMFPGPVEDYLEFRYGEDWKTPTGKKGSWRDQAANLK